MVPSAERFDGRRGVVCSEVEHDAVLGVVLQGVDGLEAEFRGRGRRSRRRTGG